VKRYRMVHMLFSHQMPQMDYLRHLVKRIRDLGANSLLLEYGDKFRSHKHSEIVSPDAFDLDELKDFVTYAESLGLEIIPLVESLGHVEYVLKHEAYRHLRETPDNPWQYCPQREETFSLLMDLYQEIIEVHPNAPYLHLGCDETWNLCQCERCRVVHPARIYSDWVNRLNREVQKRWGKQTMIWGDMMIPFTCGFRTYPEIAELLDKNVLICYWNYWGSRVFPHLKWYQEKGFKVIAASASCVGEEGQFPDQNRRIPNVIGFANKSQECNNVLGDLVTSWIGFNGPPLGSDLFGYGCGLKAMQSPRMPAEQIEREVAEQIYGTDDSNLLDAIYLLSGNPSWEDAPWRRLACQQAKEILSAYDKSDLFIGLLDLNADVYIYKANKVEVLYDVEKGRIEGTDARSRIEGVLDENQAVQQKAEKLLSRLLSPLTVKEMLKEWFGRDREILVDATSTTN